jgi:hypothetical protein
MKKNIVEKFKAWFMKQSLDEQRDLYDLLCMVREPDSENDDLKGDTTMRFRYILGLWDSRRKDVFNSEHHHDYYPAISTTPFETFEETLNCLNNIHNEGHFIGHTKEALMRLNEMGIIKSEPEKANSGTTETIAHGCGTT